MSIDTVLCTGLDAGVVSITLEAPVADTAVAVWCVHASGIVVAVCQLELALIYIGTLCV